MNIQSQNSDNQKLKPSEAMLRGMNKLGGKQTYGTAFDIGPDGQLCACALGAIALGSGMSWKSKLPGLEGSSPATIQEVYGYLREVYPELYAAKPHVYPFPHSVKTELLRMNDSEKKTLHEIQEFLQEIGL